MKAYQMAIDQLAKLYPHLTIGLTSTQAQERLEQYGPNILPAASRPPIYQMFIEQFKNPLMYLLGVAAFIIILLGNYSDAIVTVVVLLFNAIIGTLHEFRAQRALDQLQKLMTNSCIVIRDGKRHIIDTVNVVPGDIIALAEGDQVPADARIIEAQNLRVNESMLTGESESVEKNIEAVEGVKQVFEQSSMVFKGTVITSGMAKALVIGTGAETEVGKIQKATRDHSAETPLQRELDYLSYVIVIASIVLCTVLFVVGMVSGRPLPELLALLTALFICIVPEGLPMVFTLALTAAARRLAHHKVLVKRLQGTEGLGRADVIVLDKTGTLTRNEMVVRSAYTEHGVYAVTGEGYSIKGNVMQDGHVVTIEDHPELSRLRDAAFLLDTSEKKYSNDSRVQVKGEPTEAAMGVFAAKLGTLGATYHRLYSIPFDFELRLHIGFFERNERLIICISGAPEAVFAACDTIDPQAQEALKNFLAQGQRVVALATYEADLPQDDVIWRTYYEQCIGKFSFAGLIGIQDTIRPEIHNAVLKAREAGVAVVMATGDHRATASHIGRDTGILLPGDLVIEGVELADKTPGELAALNIDTVKVFARVTPQDKLTIVNLFKQRGKIVAMTGDGINDVPSIVAADVGIAMGISGTEVAKDVADLVLMDDSFTSIVHALEEGRHIFSVLRRVIWYFFSTNLSELFVIVYAFLVHIPMPLGAAQILWLNVITDGFLDVALSMEPHEPGLLRTQWHVRGRHLIDKSLAYKIGIDACIMTVGSLWLFYQWYPIDLPVAQTMMLLCLAMYQWFNAWNCRSERASILQRGIFANKWLIAVTCFVLALQIMVVYCPPLQAVFHTVPLTLKQWLTVLLLTSTIVLAEELRKLIVRRFAS